MNICTKYGVHGAILSGVTLGLTRLRLLIKRSNLLAGERRIAATILCCFSSITGIAQNQQTGKITGTAAPAPTSIHQPQRYTKKGQQYQRDHRGFAPAAWPDKRCQWRITAKPAGGITTGTHGNAATGETPEPPVKCFST